jgi:hypothetical protein
MDRVQVDDVMSPNADAGATPGTAANIDEAEPAPPVRPITAALSMTSDMHCSRQRSRNPETLPPSPEELRILIEKSKAIKEELESEEGAGLEIVDTPRENDVLLGRGRRCTEHWGNKLFREYVREKREEYNKSWKYVTMK